MESLNRNGADPGVALGVRPTLNYTGDRRMDAVVVSTFLIPLMLMGIGALGFLAYRNPELFVFFAAPAALILALILFGTLTWQMAVMVVTTDIAGAVDYKHDELLASLRDAYMLPWSIFLVLGGLVACIYILGNVASHFHDKKGVQEHAD